MTDQFERVWQTEHQGPIQVRDMKRSHVRNSLQWCLRRQDRTVLGTDMDDTDWKKVDPEYQIRRDKDGLYYRDWIAIFTARLLDPALDE
jgi:hypothetical protein